MTAGAREAKRPSETGLQVLRLLACGMQCPAIAVELGVSESAVKSRLKRLYQDLRVRTGPHAVVVAALDGFLTPADLRAAYVERRTTGEGEE